MEVNLIGLQKSVGTYRHIFTGQIILMSRIFIERFYCKRKLRFKLETTSYAILNIRL